MKERGRERCKALSTRREAVLVEGGAMGIWLGFCQLGETRFPKMIGSWRGGGEEVAGISWEEGGDVSPNRNQMLEIDSERSLIQGV
jgi:hypothetical protein